MLDWRNLLLLVGKTRSPPMTPPFRSTALQDDQACGCDALHGSRADRN